MATLYEQLNTLIGDKPDEIISYGDLNFVNRNGKIVEETSNLDINQDISSLQAIHESGGTGAAQARDLIAMMQGAGSLPVPSTFEEAQSAFNTKFNAPGTVRESSSSIGASSPPRYPQSSGESSFQPGSTPPSSTQQPKQQQQSQQAQQQQVSAPPPPLFAGPNLSKGSSGDPVKQLQQALGGLAVDGIFGPKTEAAVKQFQLQNGLKVDGIVGPNTMAALNKSYGSPIQSVVSGIKSNRQEQTIRQTDTGVPDTGNEIINELLGYLNNQSDQQTFSEIYIQAYEDLGIPDLNSQYKANSNEWEELQNEKKEEERDINDNPWFTEGKRVLEIRKLNEKYEDREVILSNKLRLLESQIDNARQDAQFLTGGIMDQLDQSAKLNQDIIIKAIDIAEKQLDAKNELDTQVIEADGRRILVDKQTGETIADFGSSIISKIPSSYQEWTLAGKPGTYADFLSGADEVVELTKASKNILLTAGFNTSDIAKIERDVSEFGVEFTVQELSEPQADAIREAYGGEDQTKLTRESISTLYNIPDNSEKTGFLGFGKTNSEKLDDIMVSIDQYQAVGFSDADILKIIQKQ